MGGMGCMVIIGAKGFSKEVLEIFFQMGYDKQIYFYDDISDDLPELLFGKFKILRTLGEVKSVFQNEDAGYSIGIGNPKNRYIMSSKFMNIGGNPCTVVSPHARIGHFGNRIDDGVIITTGTVITNDIAICEGALINLNCTIGHDSYIGRYSELSPGVHISGHCTVGDFCSVGTGAVILPGVVLGENVVIGAGAVVSKDMESNTMAVGIPARSIKKLDPLIF
jgi:sugar O-acyltransferase (sialic acid O-acetyltransferase NeuD family)